MAKSELKTKQTQIAAHGANGQQLEQTFTFEKQESYKRFKQINEYYEALIKEGVVSRRGYCLKTISDSPTFKYDKNVM